MYLSNAYAILITDMNRGTGYTILEVLIFIAISGFMLIAAMVAIGGRQQDVQFSQAARDFENKVNDIISDVEVGYFVRDAKFSCSVSGTTPPSPNIDYDPLSSETGNRQGQTGDCVLLGKTIVMGEEAVLSSNASDVVDKAVLRIFDMAGVRLDEDGNQVSTVEDAMPAPLLTGESPVTTYDLRYGLEVEKVVVYNESDSSKTESAEVLSVINIASAGSVADVANDIAPKAGSTSARVQTATFDSGISADTGINNFARDWRYAGDGESPEFTVIVICISGPNARDASGNVADSNWNNKETAALVIGSGGTTELIFDGAEEYCGA